MQALQLLQPYLIPACEIAVIAFAIYYLLQFFWNTRAMDLILGASVFLLLFLLADWLNLPVIQALMHSFVGVAMIAFLIIFQPELRLILSKLSVKGKKYEELTEFDRFLDGLTNSIYRLSEKLVGALILLENQDSLDEFASRAVILDGHFSSELLESLFTATS